jgi:3'-phosphoadenosine 5'-phosphosulfate sulfotransferase (PAPS reductase)/FAD synthetase
MHTAPRHIVGLSGGKDSTALALRLVEVEPRPYEFICTPTGNELPEMHAHWASLEQRLGSPLIKLAGGTSLLHLIADFKMLPNFRARWCTRILKIEPTIEFMESLPPGSVLYVGLRADEEEREGIFGEGLNIDFPLRRWGWGEADVWRYLAQKGVRIPNRTDCAWCYGQRLGEWYALWKKQPFLYSIAEGLELELGHTFRSPARDTWPASLEQLRWRFEAGDVPRGADAAMREDGACRVCRL